MDNSSGMAYATNIIVKEKDTHMIAQQGEVASSNRFEHESWNALLHLVKIAHEMQVFSVFQRPALSVYGVVKH